MRGWNTGCICRSLAIAAASSPVDAEHAGNRPAVTPAVPVNTCGLIVRPRRRRSGSRHRGRTRGAAGGSAPRPPATRPRAPGAKVFELEVGIEVAGVVDPATGLGVAVGHRRSRCRRSPNARRSRRSDALDRVPASGDDHDRPMAVRSSRSAGTPWRAMDRPHLRAQGWWRPRSRRRSGLRCRGTCRARTPRPSARRPSSAPQCASQNSPCSASSTRQRKSMK